jgi:hypothetical protein
VKAAAQVGDLCESLLLKIFDSFDTPRSHLAHGHNLLEGIQFIETLWQLRKRDEVTANMFDISYSYSSRTSRRNTLSP